MTRAFFCQSKRENRDSSIFFSYQVNLSWVFVSIEVFIFGLGNGPANLFGRLENMYRLCLPFFSWLFGRLHFEKCYFSADIIGSQL